MSSKTHFFCLTKRAFCLLEALACLVILRPHSSYTDQLFSHSEVLTVLRWTRPAYVSGFPCPACYAGNASYGLHSTCLLKTSRNSVLISPSLTGCLRDPTDSRECLCYHILFYMIGKELSVPFRLCSLWRQGPFCTFLPSASPKLHTVGSHMACEVNGQ